MGGRKALAAMLLCVCLCLFFNVLVLAQGVETDEDGGIWNFDQGTYTDPGGKVYTITPDGVQNEDSGSTNVKNDDGSMTVVTNEKDSVKQNQDGSIEVESGQIQVIVDEPTRAPLEGAAWQAVLDSVAARNGTETPTVWKNPATGEETGVEVIYVGIGRSMIKTDDRKLLVNTADLRWQTEAPEDQVLAVVRSRYVWLRKKPSNEITNPKLKQVYMDSVLRVLDTGPNWTFVDYKGMRAYVVTSALEFYCNDHTDVDPGYISRKGKITGNANIQIRDWHTLKILESYKVGTPITIFDVIDDWAEIDVEGWHCVIGSEYITFEKDLAAAE